MYAQLWYIRKRGDLVPWYVIRDVFFFFLYCCQIERWSVKNFFRSVIHLIEIIFIMMFLLSRIYEIVRILISQFIHIPLLFWEFNLSNEKLSKIISFFLRCIFYPNYLSYVIIDRNSVIRILSFSRIAIEKYSDKFERLIRLYHILWTMSIIVSRKNY